MLTELEIAAIPEGPAKEELLQQLQKEKAAEERRLREEANLKARDEYAMRAKAVVETALAYWRRGEVQQYDSIPLINATTRPGDLGIRRATDHVSPEDATFDSVSYFVCSTFAYNVYYEAIGYKLCGNERGCSCRNQMKITDGSVVYHWKENSGETIEEAVSTTRSLLRPGDILTSMKATGHCMVYLGDCFEDGVEYICHSWGGKYNMSTHKETHEKNGTIFLQPVDQLCFRKGTSDWYKRNKTPRWSMYDMQEIIIIRPLRIATEENYPLTPNARARLSYPGLNITRTAEPGAYRSVAKGETITYRIHIDNKSLKDYSEISVKEIIPSGTSLLFADNAAQQENTLQWSVSIPANSAAELTYTVKVSEDAPDKIIAEGGSVAGIRSNRIVTLVSPRLSETQCAKLLTIANEPPVIPSGTDTLDSIREIYTEYLDHALPLPDCKTLIAGFVKSVIAPGATGPLVKRRLPAEECQDAVKMLVHRYQGGTQLLTTGASERILEFELRYLQPGDILLYVSNPLEDSQTEKAYLYLGGTSFGYSAPAGFAITNEDVLWSAFAEDLFFCFRPSQLN